MRAFLLVLIVATSMEARDLRPELDVRGRVQELTVSPAGDLWFVTAMGHGYRSRDGGRTWTEVKLPVRRTDFLADHLDRITFFDERRAMITGYIGEDQDTILFTADGGATWNPVRLPEGMWVYDARTMPDGHAWSVGSEGEVLRSDDYGRTWRRLRDPFEKKERTLSVWFDSPDAGVVGTLFSGAIAITADGGASWQPFHAAGHAEVVRGCGKGASDKRVDKVWIGGGRVVAAQCGGVFASPVAEPRAWTRVTAGGKPLVMFAPAPDGKLVGVTAEGQVHELRPDGTSRFLGAPLQHPALSIAVSGSRIALLDATMKVALFDGESWFASRMFGAGVASSWPIAMIDRGEDDVLWGISGFFLYRSADGAKTWDRIAELPEAADRVHIQGDGNLLLANSHGWAGRWNVESATLGNVPLLNGLDIAGSFRREDLWLLFGGRQYDTAGRVEVAQTFFSGQFAGSVDYGFVAASLDGGRTWSIVDR